MLLQKGICTYNPRVSHSANGKRRSYSFLNVNGCVVRVSHILVKLVIKRIFLLNVLQVGMKHLTDYFWISFKQKRIFGNEKVSALVAKTGNRDTASAGRQRSVFHDYALLRLKTGAPSFIIWVITAQHLAFSSLLKANSFVSGYGV